MSNASTSPASSLAERIDRALTASLERGATPQIILDLDGTLFDNLPRSKHILVEESTRIFGDAAEVTARLRELPTQSYEYSPLETLRKVGVAEAGTLETFREAWAARFFSSDELHRDTPLAGAVDAARTWWGRGAELNYLTGRHVPEMYPGTSRSLHEAGFPIGTIRTQLLMKPRFDASDTAFKAETIPSIRAKGPIVLIVDNDPRVLNPLAALAPEAITVLVLTQHPKDAPPLASSVQKASDFRALLL